MPDHIPLEYFQPIFKRKAPPGKRVAGGKHQVTCLVMEKATMDTKQMMKIVEQFSRKNDPEGDAGITVTQIADHKTVFVEQSGDGGRAVMMSEYIANGKKYWAGYSSRSQTVYISQGA